VVEAEQEKRALYGAFASCREGVDSGGYEEVMHIEIGLLTCELVT